MTESELLQRAQQGDEGAVGALYRRYGSRVYAVVRRLAGDDATAEDWAQNAWMQAIRGLPRFRGDAQFGTWLHRIALNAALHGRRAERRRELREEGLPDEMPGPAPTDGPLLRMGLERALDQLPSRMREVLTLHDMEGYTHEEVGALLGVHPGTCKSQLFKARARLRELLRAEAPESPGRSHAPECPSIDTLAIQVEP